MLEKLAHSRILSRVLIERSKMILLMLEGLNNSEIAHRVHMHRRTVEFWRKRWNELSKSLEAAEEQINLRAVTDPRVKIDKELMSILEKNLSDLQRPGVPATFTAEQFTLIIAVACEDPQASGLPITHWSAAELTREVIKRGIVDHISPRTVGRFFKRSGYQTASEPLLAQHD